MTALAPLRRLTLPLLAAGLVLTAPAVRAEGLAGDYLGARVAELSGDVSAAARLYGRLVTREPENARLVERAIVYRISVGDVAGAIDLADELLAVEPENDYLPLVLGVQELRAGAFAQAITRLEERGDTFGPLLKALMIGWAQSVDDLDAADATFSSLDENPTVRAYGTYHKALAHAASGDLDGAATIFADAPPGVFSRDRRALRAQAQILSELGRNEAALAILDEALGAGVSAPELRDLRQRLAEGETVAFDMVPNATEGAAEAMYSFAQVIGASEQNRSFALLLARLALYLRDDLTEAMLLTADLLEADGQFDLAIEAYDAVPTSSPLFLLAEVGRASALSEEGRTDEAIGVLTGLTRSYPDDITAVVALGDALRQQERFAEAATAYGKAIDLLPEIGGRHWVFFYQRGMSLERSGQWDAAEADFRRALELWPDQPLVLNYLGYSLVELGRNLDEAEDMIRKAVDQRPEDGYITDSLAWVLYKIGRYQDAVEPMERAVELVPFDPVLNDHLGDILWKVGRRMEARFQWKRALSFDPEPDEVTRIRRKLELGLDTVLVQEEEAAVDGDAATARNGG